jgi:hypothetical protein
MMTINNTNHVDQNSSRAFALFGLFNHQEKSY